MHGFLTCIASSYYIYVCTPLVRKIGHGQIPEVKQSINKLTTCMTVKLQTIHGFKVLVMTLGCMDFLEEAVILWSLEIALHPHTQLRSKIKTLY